MAKNSKPKVETLPSEFVYIQKGKGPISKYTKERFEKFKENLTKSGYRVLNFAEIKAYLESKGLELEEIIEHPKPIEETPENTENQ